MQGKNNFDSMISHENLLHCWYKFTRGKTSRDDVHQYAAHLKANIAIIRHELQHQTYVPSPYASFTILYPKKRLINKAVLKDRFVQYVVFDVLTKIYDPSLISHAYASRRGKGVHKGVAALQRMFYQVTNSNKRPCYFLKCDVQKFFDSVNQDILLAILAKRIGDERFLTLLRTILYSYSSPLSNPLATSDHIGFPIGNVTSQVFSNIYMNELDQYVKHVLKMRYYLRYTDDCVFISTSMDQLKECLAKVQLFLRERLELTLHPNKITFAHHTQGIDWLGYHMYFSHRLIRTTTKKRIWQRLQARFVSAYYHQKISFASLQQTAASYLGILAHATQYQLSSKISQWIGVKLSTLRRVKGLFFLKKANKVWKKRMQRLASISKSLKFLHVMPA